MKVGTDGVLLGAWANGSGISTLLDIGTGTGLIALMMAQRFPGISIHAIETDADACEQALQNVAASGMKNIQVFHAELDDWLRFTSYRYDTVVCNPPYYEKGFAVPDIKRKKARDAAHLSLSNLLSAFNKLRKPSGTLQLVLPAADEIRVEALCRSEILFFRRKTMVFAKPGRPAKRILLELTAQESITEADELLIEHEGQHHYTQQYKRLTGDFYLNF